jgi:hypothetical protein
MYGLLRAAKESNRVGRRGTKVLLHWKGCRRESIPTPAAVRAALLSAAKMTRFSHITAESTMRVFSMPRVSRR